VWLPKGELFPRIITGIIAIPAVVFIIFQDPIFIKILGFFAALGLLREWSNLSFEKSYHWLNSICIFALIVASISILRVGALIMVIVSCGWLFYLRSFDTKKLKIICAGYLYITVAMSIIIHLMPNMGAHFILLTLTLIWCVDIGAFISGKTIGGSKLAPTISPNKTWSGFVGGIILGLIGVMLLAKAIKFDTTTSFWVFASISVVVAQGGDLLESWCKRYFKVKDSGKFLPGHGGLLDRLDSLLAVSFAVCLYWYFCIG
jgi:phosphatidate cytidylyltransferase